MDKAERGPDQLLNDLDSALAMERSEISTAHRIVLKTFFFSSLGNGIGHLSLAHLTNAPHRLAPTYRDKQLLVSGLTAKHASLISKAKYEYKTGGRFQDPAIVSR
jgi:hypothetical protein